MTRPQKVVPGPAGTSCLTCKRRHKKCDLRRPVCGRCETGGFECLGYSHNNRLPLLPLGSSRPRQILPKQEITSNSPASHAIPSSARLEGDSLDCGEEAISSSRGNENDTTSAPSSHCLEDRFISTTQHINHVDSRPNSGISTPMDHQGLLATHSPAKGALSSSTYLRSLFRLYTQIPYVPYHLSKTLLDSANLEDYVMSHFERTVERIYFRPVQDQLALIRHTYTSHLRASGFTRWIVFLNTKVCESYFQGDTSQNTTYDRWLCQTEQALRNAITKDLAPREMQDRLGNWLQVILLKTMLFQGSNLYFFLRIATPTFLQMLFSEPTLWPRGGDLTSIPLANVILSPRHELSYFALVDITTAMVFGLPQQVEYDTSPDYPSNGSVPHEWTHCTPLGFQITLADINACRDKSPNARDWREIEYRLITWQARPSKYDADLESWMIVAWFAVQESWRHTLLVYLYLAVCGVSSDDSRVQSSVRQILSVIGTVKKHESSAANAPFFVQPLMAGICARSERHRSLARQQLADVPNATPQLMRSADFVSVLDHLWHGAAAGGRPITWSDYICSREVALPVLM